MDEKNLKFWDQHHNFEEAERAWQANQALAEKSHPLKVLKNYPQMPGITEETQKNLKWKSLKWMILKDEHQQILKILAKNPFRYLFGYLKSIFKKKAYIREGDFFLYGLSSTEDFSALLKKPNTILMLGFSYCHKPFECPSGRFTDQCIHDLENPVCRQCFIGKSVHAAPSLFTVPIYIPTVHYIGKKVFELMEKYPGKEIIFLITACEMTLTMFADFGNMAAIKGVGVRLDGRICNTMKAFELSETGIKPGLTVVLPPTQSKCLEWLKLRRFAEGEA